MAAYTTSVIVTSMSSGEGLRRAGTPSVSSRRAAVHLTLETEGADKSYSRRINDYLRAVEEALAHLPASRRAELLANLSDRIAARRAELHPNGELAEILELLDDNGVVPENEVPPEPEPEQVEITPGRRAGALAWVLIVAAAMLVMCVAAVLTFAAFMVKASLK